MEQEQAPVTYLQIADWRRQIAALYAQVRDLAAADPVAAWTHWRVVREGLYRTHPQSPVPAPARADFRARHFPYDPALRFETLVLPHAGGPGLTDAPAGNNALDIPTSGGGTMGFRRLGWVDVPFPDGPRRLALSWLTGYAGGLFLSFRDATGGAETYGGGRYLLDAAKSADLGGDPDRGTVLLDFNFAYQPSCAFDPQWVCPLVPPENRLDFPLRAGERIA
jgi:uncharacterized protein (DUF1684 family)